MSDDGGIDSDRYLSGSTPDWSKVANEFASSLILAIMSGVTAVISATADLPGRIYQGVMRWWAAILADIVGIPGFLMSKAGLAAAADASGYGAVSFLVGTAAVVATYLMIEWVLSRIGVS